MAVHSRLEFQLIPWSTLALHGGLEVDSQADFVVFWQTDQADIQAWMRDASTGVRSAHVAGRTLAEALEQAGAALLSID